jgi:hypothetical protein
MHEVLRVRHRGGKSLFEEAAAGRANVSVVDSNHALEIVGT